MTTSLEDLVCAKFIQAYKTAPLFFQSIISKNICKEMFKHWGRELPNLVWMIKKQANEETIQTDWEKYYPKELVQIAKEIAFDLRKN